MSQGKKKAGSLRFYLAVQVRASFIETVPLICVEQSHAEHRDDPGDQRNYDNADNDRHAPSTHCRQDLSSDDTGDDTIAHHKDYVEHSNELRRPVAHEVSCDNLLDT